MYSQREMIRTIQTINWRKTPNSRALQADARLEYQKRRDIFYREYPIVSKLTDHQLKCRTSQTINPNAKFLVDSGSDLNLIKISALKDDVIVYEDITYHLKGISDQLV